MSRTTIAVFGSSQPQPGDDAYALALETGAALAAAGYAVITGGYGGVMQAASEGARRHDGIAIGVTSELFSHREPNPFITDEVPTSDLYERTRELVDRADGYIVLPGQSGTLAELAWVWALLRGKAIESRPLIAVGRDWQAFFAWCDDAQLWDEPTRRCSRIAGDATEVVGWLDRWNAETGSFR